MSSMRSRGRPRRTWTHRQTRQLARLYSLTTLSNAEILALLEREGVPLSERHLQMKLRSIYPKEYVENLHDLRPRSHSMMRLRLRKMRQSCRSRISKAVRYSQVKSLPGATRCKPIKEVSDFEFTRNAFRNYNVPVAQDLQKYLSQYPLRDSQPTNSLFLMLDGSTMSKQPLIDPQESQHSKLKCLYCEQQAPHSPIEPTMQFKCGHVCHEACLSKLFEQPPFPALVPRRCPSCNAPLVLDPRSGIAPGKLNNTSKRNHDFEQVAGYPISTNILARETPEKEEKRVSANLSANVLHLNEQSKPENAFDDVRRRLENRSPSYTEDVISVMRLSLSDSNRTISSLERVASSPGWSISSRSSWMSMSSLSSKFPSANSSRMSFQSLQEKSRHGPINFGRAIFYKVVRAAPLGRKERDIWNEIIDEAQLLPVRESRPPNPKKDFFDRCCAGKLDTFDISLCSHCGDALGRYHWYPCTGDYKAVDSFGNTKLHYAAASRGADLNLFRLLIDNGIDVGARNNSGETFMHVLKIKNFIGMHGWLGYLKLLRFLSDLRFPFFQRDFHGRTIAHSFSQYLGSLCFCSKMWPHILNWLFDALEILNLDMNALDNHGFNAGDQIIHSTEEYASKMKRDSSEILPPVKMIIDSFRRHQPLEISFRETLAELDWTPIKWIEWLKELDLITWIDPHGDTPLTALLKNRRKEEEQAALSETIFQLVRLGVDVNMRDRKGHTAIAIAVVRGSLSCVQALLDSGADANTMNYRGRDTESIASWRMKLAKREGKTQCYARILACINLLVDKRGNG